MISSTLGDLLNKRYAIALYFIWDFFWNFQFQEVQESKMMKKLNFRRWFRHSEFFNFRKVKLPDFELSNLDILKSRFQNVGAFHSKKVEKKMSHDGPHQKKEKKWERKDTVWDSLGHFTSLRCCFEYVVCTTIAIRCVYDTNMEHTNSKWERNQWAILW